MLVGVADLGNGLELTSIYALEQYGNQHQINALGFFYGMCFLCSKLVNVL
jgi:hypothetical protein